MRGEFKLWFKSNETRTSRSHSLYRLPQEPVMCSRWRLLSQPESQNEVNMGGCRSLWSIWNVALLASGHISLPQCHGGWRKIPRLLDQRQRNLLLTVGTKQGYLHLLYFPEPQFSLGDTKNSRNASLPRGVFDRRGATSLGNPNLFNGLTFALEKDITFIVLDIKQTCHFLWRRCISLSFKVVSHTFLKR